MILYKLLQDFSIYFPFITEEIYQELYKDNKSIHLTEIKEFEYQFDEENKYGEIICDIISEARGKKSESNMSLKTPIKEIIIECNSKIEEAINKSIKDFKATLFIENLTINNTNDDKYNIDKIELEITE